MQSVNVGILILLGVWQMMKGASREQKEEWQMAHGQRFNWLPTAQKTLEGNRLRLSCIIMFTSVLVVRSSCVNVLVRSLSLSFTSLQRTVSRRP